MAGLILATLSLPAHAQFANQYGIDMRAIMQARQAQQAIQMQQAAQEAAEAQAAEQAARERGAANLKQAVGKLVSEGKCEDAKNMALRNGDFNLAKDALSLCQPESQASSGAIGP